MPWEIIGTIATAFGVKIAGDIMFEGVRPHIKKVFEERGISLISRIVRRSHSQKYLSLSSTDLISFYQKEEALSETLGEEVYQLPITLVIPPSVDGPITKEKIQYKLFRNHYEMRKEIAPYTAPVIANLNKQKKYFDGSVVSLRDMEIQDNSILLKFAPASYFQGLATNYSMDHRPRNCSTTLRERVHGTSRNLCNFKDSYLANHIGVGCMLETIDGYIVASRRSKRVSIWPKSLAISINAVLKYDDIYKNIEGSETEQGDLGDLAKCAFREGLEELGIRPQNLLFLGLVRDFLRGGKPDFYFYGRSNLTFNEMKKSPKNKRS